MVKVPPYAVRVGEQLLPKPIGGHPALELCNTFAGWGEPAGAEWLKDYRLLAVWAEFTGLVPAARDLPVRSRSAAAVLDEVRSFRAALYRLLLDGAGSAAIPGGTAFADVAARVDQANALRRLAPGPDGSATLALPPSRDVRLPLHAAALAAADLLARPERTSVHACPGHGCGWLFLDPRGRRVWCSMAACGNRAKVRAHAARNR
jgi:predicted RNA-binding Zn ribbon-like protein